MFVLFVFLQTNMLCLLKLYSCLCILYDVHYRIFVFGERLAQLRPGAVERHHAEPALSRARAGPPFLNKSNKCNIITMMMIMTISFNNSCNMSYSSYGSMLYSSSDSARLPRSFWTGSFFASRVAGSTYIHIYIYIYIYIYTNIPQIPSSLLSSF